MAEVKEMAFYGLVNKNVLPYVRFKMKIYMETEVKPVKFEQVKF
jgi:hypothetical protein